MNISAYFYLLFLYDLESTYNNLSACNVNVFLSLIFFCVALGKVHHLYANFDQIFGLNPSPSFQNNNNRKKKKIGERE